MKGTSTRHHNASFSRHLLVAAVIYTRQLLEWIGVLSCRVMVGDVHIYYFCYVGSSCAKSSIEKFYFPFTYKLVNERHNLLYTAAMHEVANSI